MNESNESGAMSVRDHFAMVALGALLRGAMEFDSVGLTRAGSMEDDLIFPTFAKATTDGWEAKVGSIEGQSASYADFIASDAYCLADAMIRERSRQPLCDQDAPPRRDQDIEGCETPEGNN